MPRLLLGLVVVPLLVLLAACGPDDILEPGDDAASVADLVEGREFLSTAVAENGADRPLVDGTTIRLSFRDGSVGWSAGCNSGGGPYSFDGDVLVVTELATTEMGCDPERHAQDEFVTSVLGDRPTLGVAGNVLTITTETVVIELLDRVEADPDLPIVGTRWEVTGFVDGDVAMSMAGGEGWIEFADDSSFEGFDGCNTVYGPVEVSDGSTGGPVEGDGELQWGTIVNTDVDCGATEFETRYRAMFATGAATYEITARNLTIVTSEGAGVTFRATDQP